MRTRTLAVVVASLGLVGVVHADTVNVQYLGTGQGRNVKINLNGNARNVFAGQLEHRLTGGVGAIGSQLNGVHLTYCTDLTQTVTSTSQLYNVVGIPNMPLPPMGLEKAQAIYDIYAGLDGAQLAETVDSDLAAAFQIAVWEIVADFNPISGVSSLNVTSGSLHVTRTDGSALSSAIMNHFNSLKGYIGLNALNPGLYGLANGSSQDQIVQFATVIPLPSAGLMACAGLIGLGARRRR